jgi:hypothetical protein
MIFEIRCRFVAMLGPYAAALSTPFANLAATFPLG